MASSKINQYQRAFLAWDVLAEVAKSKSKTITYSDLATKINVHHRAVRYVLGVIQDYCITSGLPPLTILVVNKGNGKPGHGFIAHDPEDFEAGLDMVAAYNWNVLPNPFYFAADGLNDFDELVNQLATNPDSSEEIYRKVKDRGVRQMLFRKALRQAYDDTCAFTGISYSDDGLLEACHIVPWAEATPAERLDVRNGILLNPLHHKLFDRQYLTIDEQHVMHYEDHRQERWEHNVMEKTLTVKLHGKKMLLPDDKACAPGADFIARHNKKVSWI
ncbi:MAG: HNH endonuclease [Comamonas sp.]|jgi:putative restriction endonuclease|uniref:HNH endonuclease n=1 Tax=Comamonas sp. TaxID=34028 RepID=UPI0028366723|nr:HNH endonuclease signature motif containing protein [Comamonas sp.]MDR0216408.1 HNH endonuclease [Comamonas sp.]